MSIIQSDLLLGQEGSSKYQVSRSLRFNSADSAYLSRTPASAGNRKTWTYSVWVKRSKLNNGSGQQAILSANLDGTDPGQLNVFFHTTDQLYITNTNSNLRVTNQVFRDVSAWYHIVIAVDTTSATASNRIRVYVNGTESTFAQTSDPSQNSDTGINSVTAHNIGRYVGGSLYSDLYLADIWLLDGIAATPSDFAATDATTGQWIPKAYTGSKGTNGFHLEFADNSAATAAALGKDTSGNGNNFSPVNLQVGSSYYSSGGNNAQLTSGSFQNLFDPSLSTGAYLSPNGSSATVRYTFPNPVSGSIRFYGSAGGGAPNNTANCATITLSTGQTYDFGSNSYSNPGWSTTWTVSNLQWVDLFGRNIPGNSDGLFLRAVELNGVLLVDSVYSDSLVDTPTSYGTDTGAGGEVRGNYATWNPLAVSTYPMSFVNGNLDTASGGQTQWKDGWATISPATGKWYWEYKVNSDSASTGTAVGLATLSAVYHSSNNYIYARRSGGGKIDAGSYSAGVFTSVSNGDILGFAYDADAQKLWTSLNGTFVGSPTAGTGQSWSNVPANVFPYVSNYNDTTTVNFGQRAFSYQAPAGFKALVDTNLPSPSVAKSASAFDVKLYTGNSSSQTISGLGFSPDLVWIKDRTQAFNHALHDIVRGAGAQLITNDPTGEVTTNQVLTAFTSSGFTVNWVSGVGRSTNESPDAYVAWCWDAGSSTVTNTQGSITSSVRANASAGFSVVSFSSSSTGGTVGHGLNVAPSLIICKNRDSTSNWPVYHTSLGTSGNNTLILDGTNAAYNSNYLTAAAPTSSVFSHRGFGASSTANYIAYCFAAVSGYSSAFSFTGNGSSDGPAVWLGFKPALILVKRTDSTGDWRIWDMRRDGYNVTFGTIAPNSSSAENTSEGAGVTGIDFLSNGFKLRSTGSFHNASGGTYVGFAWAENPFQYARAR